MKNIIYITIIASLLISSVSKVIADNDTKSPFDAKKSAAIASYEPKSPIDVRGPDRLFNHTAEVPRTKVGIKPAKIRTSSPQTSPDILVAPSNRRNATRMELNNYFVSNSEHSSIRISEQQQNNIRLLSPQTVILLSRDDSYSSSQENNPTSVFGESLSTPFYAPPPEIGDEEPENPDIRVPLEGDLQILLMAIVFFAIFRFGRFRIKANN